MWFRHTFQQGRPNQRAPLLSIAFFLFVTGDYAVRVPSQQQVDLGALARFTDKSFICCIDLLSP